MISLIKENGILLSCDHVSTIVWLHHMDFNETRVEKA